MTSNGASRSSRIGIERSVTSDALGPLKVLTRARAQLGLLAASTSEAREVKADAGQRNGVNLNVRGQW
jgi:hypothetical protein